MFTLTASPIDPAPLKEALQRPEAGACVTFEGRVRNTNEGRGVTRLEYEAFEAVAKAEGDRILEEARRRFQLIEVSCVHRIGTLAIGDMAVWVGASAGHRDAAFAACRYIIDEVKRRVPIWKKEHYTDGDSGWVNCEQPGASAVSLQPAETLTESAYYARQMRLPLVGEAGQKKLGESRVLIIGVGGLGCPAAQYLAAAGVGTIGICDGDRVDASNLHRQVLFGPADIGAPKAERAAERLRALNPFIKVEVHTDRLTCDNALALFEPYDVILDCTDNFEAKFLINDAAVLTHTPAVFAALHQFEGQLQVYLPDQSTPCLRCQWPEMPEPDCVGTCADVGILGAVPGVFGALQAMEALKILLDLPGAGLRGAVVMHDLLAGDTLKANNIRNPDCPVCGERPVIDTLDVRNYGGDEGVEIHLDHRGMEALAGFQIIDVREPGESRDHPIDGVGVIELSAGRFEQDTLPFSTDQRCLLCCTRGLRSRYLARRLRARGYANVYSLKGGIAALQASHRPASR